MISPTEPVKLRKLGTVGMFPERFGADILVATAGGGWAGVQRKEKGDLLSSLGDGRLGEQVAKMKVLDVSLLIIEGDLHWTNDGVLIGSGKYGQEVTRKYFEGVMWSIQRAGTWVLFTSSLSDTCESVVHFEDWMRKEKHHGLGTRGPVESQWGRPDSRDFQIHLLTGLPNVGPELAGRILDRFGMPFRWRDDVTVETLQEVAGIGKKKAASIMKGLR